MTDNPMQDGRRQRLFCYIMFLVVGWSGAVVTSLLWNYYFPTLKMATLYWGHFAWWLLGLLAIGFCFVGMHRHLAKRQLAEAEMAAMRAYLQNIINSMPTVLVGINGDGLIVQWNQEAVRITGKTVQEAEGRPLNDMFPTLGSHMAAIKMAVMDRQPLKIEKILNGSSATSYSDFMVDPLRFHDAEGAVVRVVEVNDQTLSEDRRFQAEKMQSVARLAEGMAHEINNPLGGIIQGAQSILRRVSPTLVKNVEVAEACGTDLEKIRSYLEQRQIFRFLDGIRNYGERAASIVSYMQQFSRCREAQMEPRSLSDIMETALGLVTADQALTDRLGFRQIEVVRDFDSRLSEIPCSAIDIEQVFFNLIKNAAQALQEVKGDRPPRLVLRTRREGAMATIEIEDNGSGMAEETRKRIFEPFYTTKPPGQGTGLGMAVAYFIVTVAHRGTLTVESEPGKGTKVIIGLPLQ